MKQETVLVLLLLNTWSRKQCSRILAMAKVVLVVAVAKSYLIEEEYLR